LRLIVDHFECPDIMVPLSNLTSTPDVNLYDAVCLCTGDLLSIIHQ
jgi:hypothetical protein